MPILFLLGLLLFVLAHGTLQAPTGANNEAPHVHHPKRQSLQHLIKERTDSNLDMQKLDGLTGEDFFNEAKKLRSSIEDQDATIKTHFRKILNHYMVNRNFDKDFQLHVKSRLSQGTKAQAAKRYRSMMKEKDPIGWKQKRAKDDAASIQRQRDRKVALGKGHFEQMVEGLGLPANAKAGDVEKAVRDRGIGAEDPKYTTGQLRRYLNKRFDPKDVQDAMANRSYQLYVKSRSQYVKLKQPWRRQSEKRGKGGNTSRNGTSEAEPVSTSTSKSDFRQLEANRQARNGAY